MEVVVAVGAGLDVHKKTIAVCCIDGRSTPELVFKRTFGTFRHQLEELREWLERMGCTTVAMESTGVYWLPVYRALEGHVEVVLGNARLMANVPGRKTDQCDAHWIAQLLRFGLIRKNFIPPRPIFELRQLTRTRRKLIETRTAAELRVEKLLQIANMKLSSVASEVFGVSGRLMLNALAQGQTDPNVLADLSRGKLRNKRPELIKALSGSFTEDDRRLLAIQLKWIEDLNARLATLSVLMEAKAAPYEAIVEHLDTVPGINRILAIEIVAETGGEMSCWPSEHHFAAWCGVCPGNRESAGKRRRARVRDGRPAMKRILAQAATSAGLSTGTYLCSRYRSFRNRRGEGHATLAIAHEIAISIYFMLKRGNDYQPPIVLDPVKQREVRRRKLVRELERLGYTVACNE